MTVGSGGTLGPLAAALAAGGGSIIGSQIGGSASDGQLLRDKRVKIADSPTSEGRFLQGKRQMFETQKQQERDALKEYQQIADNLLLEQQLTGALTSGVTAGMDAGLGDLIGLGSKANKSLTTGSSLGSQIGSGIGVGSQFGQGQGNIFSSQFNKIG
jgi:hypothetical protein